MARRAKKELYHAKLHKLLEDFERAFIVHADNVGSKQFMDIRRGLYPDSMVLMGKNTMMKRSIRLYCEQSGSEDWAAVIPQLVGNVGLVFTKKELADLKDEIAKYKVGAPAKVGATAPKDVIVPAGGTGMDPSQTSFFQALGVATKINRGTIEIVTDVHLIEAGKKVGGSEATLLAKLGIKPFEYGLKIHHVYDQGALYDPQVLEIKDENILSSVMAAIGNVTAVALQTGYPTEASLPHVVMNGYKNVLAIALATEFSFPLADKVKEILENPEAFAAVAAATAAPVAKAAGGAAPAAEEKVEEEEEEEEDEDMGFSLFD